MVHNDHVWTDFASVCNLHFIVDGLSNIGPPCGSFVYLCLVFPFVWLGVFFCLFVFLFEPFNHYLNDLSTTVLRGSGLEPPTRLVPWLG